MWEAHVQGSDGGGGQQQSLGVSKMGLSDSRGLEKHAHSPGQCLPKGHVTGVASKAIPHAHILVPHLICLEDAFPSLN